MNDKILIFIYVLLVVNYNNFQFVWKLGKISWTFTFHEFSKNRKSCEKLKWWKFWWIIFNNNFILIVLFFQLIERRRLISSRSIFNDILKIILNVMNFWESSQLIFFCIFLISYVSFNHSVATTSPTFPITSLHLVHTWFLFFKQG